MKAVDGQRGELEPLVELARRSAQREAAAGPDVGAVDRLVTAQRSALTRQVKVRRSAALAGVALSIAAAVAVFHVSQPPPSLSLTLVRAAESAQGKDQTVNRYSFSDGTTVSVPGDGVVEVASLESERPRVRLTRGEAHVHVVHRPSAHWTFAAGPFDVDVIGTTFDLHWDEREQTFGLYLSQGRVVVHGPVLDQPLTVEPGQRVWVSVPGRSFRVVSKPAEGPSASLGANPFAPAKAIVIPPAASARTAPLVTGSQPSAADVTPPRAALHEEPTSASTSWRSLVARGKFARVITEANARPLASCLASCSAGDLRALGDAARYSSNWPVAEQALLSLRKRFGGSGEGGVAAFLLARTYEAKHQWGEAERWYARYLAEAPSGEFAVDAAAGRARVTKPR